MSNYMYKFIGYVSIVSLLLVNPVSGFCQIEDSALQVSGSEIDNMVDTVMGKQELEFQNSVEEQAVGDKVALRQFIIDSLQISFEDKLQEIIDSVRTFYENKIEDESAVRDVVIDSLTKAFQEIDSINVMYSEQIKTLIDSVMNLNTRLLFPSRGIVPAYDINLEDKYFSYCKMLKMEESKQKKGILKLRGGGENIYPFQIEELKRYLETFFPEARCDSVQDFLTQLYIRKGDWSKAEFSLLKFIHLYPNSPLYEEVKSIRSGVFQTEKSYRKDSDYLMSLIGTIPAYPNMDIRYFKFVELLKGFPNPEIKRRFIEEAKKFLQVYPFSPKSPLVNLWIGETLLKNEQDQRAFMYYKRLMTFYPESDEMRIALYRNGLIQEEKFEEYRNAIDSFNSLIEKFPDDTLAISAHYHIAKIADTYLKNWEKAVKEYQIFANSCSESEKSISALMRKAAILASEMNLIEDAVATYKSIDERYPDTPGAYKSIILSGDLYENHKRYEAAIAQYMSLFEKYPESDKSLDALEKVAAIYRGKIKDVDKTIETLNLIIANFPNTKSEAKALKQLKKLEKSK